MGLITFLVAFVLASPLFGAAVNARNGVSITTASTINGVTPLAAINGQIVVSGSFTPPDIANLILWLQADTITGLMNDDPVATWTDDSGSGNTVTQATAGKRALYKTNILNSLPSVRFDGTDDDYAVPTITLAGDFSLFIVQQTAGDKMFFTNDSSSNRQLFRIGQSGGNTISAYDGADNPISSTLAKARTSASLIEEVRASGSILFYEDGVARSGGSSTGTYVVKFFGSQEGTGVFMSGDIFEVVMYSDDLSGTDRVLVENYLINKYGL